MTHPSTTSRRRLGAVLFCSVLLLGACGGGGGGTDASATPLDPSPDFEPLTIPGADSFSPLFLAPETEEGEPVTWFYQVNGGLPLEVVAEEGTFELLFPADLAITFDPRAGMRLTNGMFHFTGTVPGRADPVTGQGTIDLAESFDRPDDCAQILGRMAQFAMFEDGVEPQLSVETNSELVYLEPLTWLPDCTDLDLRLGSEAATPGDTHVVGTVGSQRDGLPVRGTGFEMSPATPDRWTVIEIIPEYAVLDHTFRNVVVAELETIVPDLGCPEEPGESAPRTVRMWFAKNVGLIRAEGTFTLWGNPVRIELVSVAR